MAEIDNYEDSSAQASDDVESSEEKTDSGDEESSRDTRDTGDEDDDPLSLPICAREISSKSYNIMTWMDELGSFPAKIPVRARMTLHHDFRKLLVQEKNYNDFKVMYLKNKINLKKQSEVYNERGNASYALYGFPWAFLVWIYEAFPHLCKYAKKSLDSPLPFPRLLRWNTIKRDNIIEGD
ncbi:hypothetical protein KY290_021067 [Solanum tuberosum]|uniref:Uncharacterized protein n=1 Tax=Solanum tuberosum TaxID=4113 RepID=A0ABQ7V0G3_SOLTU|nr:hypothetical protein KY289_020250 [Solanum tuberosum]KAH0692912.1 hypothetical protein KY285_020009 [Solanum tuberosum]KAH0757574.1 hypothetical protein KY290_021067 [Solanum tuberosum]